MAVAEDNVAAGQERSAGATEEQEEAARTSEEPATMETGQDAVTAAAAGGDTGAAVAQASAADQEPQPSTSGRKKIPTLINRIVPSRAVPYVRPPLPNYSALRNVKLESTSAGPSQLDVKPPSLFSLKTSPPPLMAQTIEPPMRAFSPAVPPPPRTFQNPPVVTYGAQDYRARLNLQRQAEVFRSQNPNDNTGPVPSFLTSDQDISRRAWNAQVRHPSLAMFKNYPFAEYELNDPRGHFVPPFNRFALDHVQLTEAQLANQKFMDEPSFHLRCTYCSSSHCSRHMLGSDHVNCRRYWHQISYSPTRRVCIYARCQKPTDHIAIVCPYLHKRCPKCHCRGHDLFDKCDPSNEMIMARLRADFEACAHMGHYTRRRVTQGDVGWGFYPLTKEIEASCSYRYLAKLEVVEALAFLSALTTASNLDPDSHPDYPLAPQEPSRPRTLPDFFG